MVTTCPSRITWAEGAAISFKVSRVFSVRYSCTNPNIALRITMAMMVSASVISPISTDKMVEISRIITIRSRNCPKKIFSGPLFFLADKVFSPASSSLFCASLEVRPSCSN